MSRHGVLMHAPCTLRYPPSAQVRCPADGTGKCPSAAQRSQAAGQRVRRHGTGGTVCGGRDGFRHAGHAEPRPISPGCAAWTPTPWARTRRPRRSSGPRSGWIPGWLTAGWGCTRCGSTPPPRCCGCTGTATASANSAVGTAARSTPGTGWAGGCSRCWRARVICCSRTPRTGWTAAMCPSWTGLSQVCPPVDTDPQVRFLHACRAYLVKDWEQLVRHTEPLARRPAAGHRGGSVRRHGPGPPGDVRTGRAAALRGTDALPQRAAAAQGTALLAGPGTRGHRPQRGRPAPVPGGAPRRPRVHGHLGPARGDRRGDGFDESADLRGRHARPGSARTRRTARSTATLPAGDPVRGGPSRRPRVAIRSWRPAGLGPMRRRRPGEGFRQRSRSRRGLPAGAHRSRTARPGAGRTGAHGRPGTSEAPGQGSVRAAATWRGCGPSRACPVQPPKRHFVFSGPSGTGKTTVARILGRVFYALGLLGGDHLVEAQRADLVGEFLGQTAVKANELIDSALGGVLFVDEAYSALQLRLQQGRRLRRRGSAGPAEAR